MRALSLLGFAVSLVCAGVGAAEMAGFGGVLMWGVVLVWAWATRARVPEAQGRATIACAFGLGFVGVAGGYVEVAGTLAATDAGAARLLAGVAMAQAVAGLALCVYACRALAIGKGRSSLLCLLGLLNVVGYTILLFVPARRDAVPDLGTPPVL